MRRKHFYWILVFELRVFVILLMNSTQLEKWKWKRKKHNWSKYIQIQCLTYTRTYTYSYLSWSGKRITFSFVTEKTIYQGAFNNYVDIIMTFFDQPTTLARKLFTQNVENYKQFLEPLLTSFCPHSYWMPPKSTLVNISPQHISLCHAYSIDETYKVHMRLKPGNLLSFHATIVR